MMNDEKKLTPIGQFTPDGNTFTAAKQPISLLRDKLFWQSVALAVLTVVHVANAPAGALSAEGLQAVIGSVTSAIGPLFGVPMPAPTQSAYLGMIPAITPLAAWTVKQATADIQHGVPSFAGRLFGRPPTGCLNLRPAYSWTFALALFVVLSIVAVTSSCTYTVAGLEAQVARIATHHAGFCTADVRATVKGYSPNAEYVVDCPTECPATMTAFTVVTTPVCTVYEKK